MCGEVLDHDNGHGASPRDDAPPTSVRFPRPTINNLDQQSLVQNISQFVIVSAALKPTYHYNIKISFMLGEARVATTQAKFFLESRHLVGAKFDFFALV